MLGRAVKAMCRAVRRNLQQDDIPSVLVGKY